MEAGTGAAQLPWASDGCDGCPGVLLGGFGSSCWWSWCLSVQTPVFGFFWTCPQPQPCATSAGLLPHLPLRASHGQDGIWGQQPRGRAPSLAAPPRAAGSHHLHFLTSSSSWERAELSRQVTDQSQTCCGSPREGGPARHPSPSHGDALRGIYPGTAARDAARELPLHPWGQRDVCPAPCPAQLPPVPVASPDQGPCPPKGPCSWWRTISSASTC